MGVVRCKHFKRQTFQLRNKRITTTTAKLTSLTLSIVVREEIIEQSESENRSRKWIARRQPQNNF